MNGPAINSHGYPAAWDAPRNDLKELAAPARFSVFKAPIRNTSPYKAITLPDAHKAIVQPHYKPIVERIRAAGDKATASKIKAEKLPYFTFSGTFTKRGNAHLEKHSGLICMDIDGLPPDALPDAKNALLTDTEIETELLFISPSGNGLKWVIAIEASDEPEHHGYFLAVEKYLKTRHGLQTDKACKDVARACFISYDASAFLNAKHGK